MCEFDHNGYVLLNTISKFSDCENTSNMTILSLTFIYWLNVCSQYTWMEWNCRDVSPSLSQLRVGLFDRVVFLLL